MTEYNYNEMEALRLKTIELFKGKLTLNDFTEKELSILDAMESYLRDKDD